MAKQKSGAESKFELRLIVGMIGNDFVGRIFDKSRVLYCRKIKEPAESADEESRADTDDGTVSDSTTKKEIDIKQSDGQSDHEQVDSSTTEPIETKDDSESKSDTDKKTDGDKKDSQDSNSVSGESATPAKKKAPARKRSSNPKPSSGKSPRSSKLV